MRIAITGGIAEGKSTVLAHLRELGEAVASSDDLARGVFLRDGVQAQIAALMGEQGPVEPTKVRERLSTDPAFRRSVNSITHPLVLQEIASCKATWVEVPLLFETCLQILFERIWVVTCGPQEQMRRLVERLGSESEARRMIGTQLPTEVKCAFADEIIRTNASREVVKAFIANAASLDIGK